MNAECWDWIVWVAVILAAVVMVVTPDKEEDEDAEVIGADRAHIGDDDPH